MFQENALHFIYVVTSHTIPTWVILIFWFRKWEKNKKFQCLNNSNNYFSLKYKWNSYIFPIMKNIGVEGVAKA